MNMRADLDAKKDRCKKHPVQKKRFFIVSSTSSRSVKFEETQMGTRRIEDKRSSSSGWLLFRDPSGDLQDETTRKAISLEIFFGCLQQGLAIDLLLPEDVLFLVIELNAFSNQVVDECL